MTPLMQILTVLGIAVLYWLLCIAYFYAREWFNHHDDYDDYQDRAG